VRTFIDLLVENLRQMDWDPRAYNGERSPLTQTVSANDPRPAPKRKSSAMKEPGSP
jgi:hypothetical protein